MIFTPRACARGKAIAVVCQIARSPYLGVWASSFLSSNCKTVKNQLSCASNRLTRPSRATNLAFWCTLLATPINHTHSYSASMAWRICCFNATPRAGYVLYRARVGHDRFCISQLKVQHAGLLMVLSIPSMNTLRNIIFYAPRPWIASYTWNDIHMYTVNMISHLTEWKQLISPKKFSPNLTSWLYYSICMHACVLVWNQN